VTPCATGGRHRRARGAARPLSGLMLFMGSIEAANKKEEQALRSAWASSERRSFPDCPNACASLEGVSTVPLDKAARSMESAGVDAVLLIPSALARAGRERRLGRRWSFSTRTRTTNPPQRTSGCSRF